MRPSLSDLWPPKRDCPPAITYLLCSFLDVDIYREWVIKSTEKRIEEPSLRSLLGSHQKVREEEEVWS